MHSLQESLASWATILGTLLSFAGLIQSRAWLTGMSLLLVIASIIAGLYARSERLILNSAAVKVEGRSIDSLNIANLRRHVNGSLVIQEARHVAEIEGEDLKIAWKYSGYCRAEEETSMEFSIDTDSNIPFDRLECCAYDLGRDPGREHQIRPILIGPDGISKKIAVPFLDPLRAQQPFCLLLECALPGCMKAGLEYYTSTLSFGQDQVRRSTVRLRFFGERPVWVRVYECAAAGGAKLLRDLRPARENQKLTEYVDIAEHVPAQSAKIYVFWRGTAVRTDDSPRPTAVRMSPSNRSLRSDLVDAPP
jgi:hypothetical protein